MNDPSAFVTEAIARLQVEVPERAIIAASGGIDSTTAAVLAERALGERARAVFVDTGLLREGEVETVSQLFRTAGLRFEVVPAADRFLSALEGVTEPEEKRQRIGTAFIRLFEEEASRFHTDRLIQGTIAPDWIESGGSIRDTIKTHHNVGERTGRLATATGRTLARPLQGRSARGRPQPRHPLPRPTTVPRPRPRGPRGRTGHRRPGPSPASRT